MGLGMKLDYYLGHRNAIESVQSPAIYFPLNKPFFFCSSTSKLKSKFASLPLRANMLLYLGSDCQEVLESVITAALLRLCLERRCVPLVFVRREVEGRAAPLQRGRGSSPQRLLLCQRRNSPTKPSGGEVAPGSGVALSSTRDCQRFKLLCVCTFDALEDVDAKMKQQAAPTAECEPHSPNSPTPTVIRVCSQPA